MFRPTVFHNNIFSPAALCKTLAAPATHPHVIVAGANERPKSSYGVGLTATYCCMGADGSSVFTRPGGTPGSITRCISSFISSTAF